MNLVRWLIGALGTLLVVCPAAAQDCVPSDPIQAAEQKARQERQLEETIQRACAGQSANCFIRMQEATDPGYQSASGRPFPRPRRCADTIQQPVVPPPTFKQVAAPHIEPKVRPKSTYSVSGPTGPRLAMVVGNSAYGRGLGGLANAVNDANAVSSALRQAGFQVVEITNADQRSLKRAIADFGRSLSERRGATGLFYYAGHGMQSRGVNYLIPVGADIQAEADIDLDAVAAETVMRQMEEAGASTIIVILDACRNLPVQRNFRDSTRGLARMDAPNGSFVAYSTAPGSVASDGTGTNSPFASALIAEIRKPDQPIEITFRNVRRRVIDATRGKQTPWDSSSLVDNFVFTPSIKR